MLDYAFSRIIDLQNFMKVIYDCVTPLEQSVIVHRLGWFNILSAFNLNRVYQFHLDDVESRRLAIILMQLSEIEPGENWKDPEFRKEGINGDLLHGWQLPIEWCNNPAERVPKHGYLKFCWNTEAKEHRLEARLNLDPNTIASESLKMRVEMAHMRLLLDKECFLNARKRPQKALHPNNIKELERILADPHGERENIEVVEVDSASDCSTSDDGFECGDV